MVDVLNVNAPGTGTLLHQCGKQVGSRNDALAYVRVLLVFRIETFKFVLIGKERLVQSRNLVGRKQRNIAALNQAGVQQAVDLYAVIKLADTVVFHTTVVFQHQQAFGFDVPQWIEQGCRTTTHAALRTGFDCRLKHFEKRDAAGMPGFAAPDFAV